MPFQPIMIKLPYIAYLVRLWQDNQQGPWRASAQSVQTGEKVLFASPAELFAFLEGQTLAGSADDQVPSLT
jgi:hypothetical protein